jgi:hypothetical protein
MAEKKFRRNLAPTRVLFSRVQDSLLVPPKPPECRASGLQALVVLTLQRNTKLGTKLGAQRGARDVRRQRLMVGVGFCVHTKCPVFTRIKQPSRLKGWCWLMCGLRSQLPAG